MKKFIPALYVTLALMLSACASSIQTREAGTSAGNSTGTGGAGGEIAEAMEYMAKQETDLQQLARVDEVSIERQQTSISITFTADFLFEVSSLRLNPSGCEEIYHVAEVLRRYPKTVVRVNGHTDSTGTEQCNLDLSERRACAVMDALVNAGVPPSRITAQGLGKACPVASEDTEAGKRTNRRVILEIIAVLQS